jgi:cytidyltransferase-like protein
MEKYHVSANVGGRGNQKKKSYSMFVGRWQPWHSGHQWLVEQRLQQNKNVLICIRDVEPDEKNPFTAEEVERNIKQHLWRLLGEERVKVMIIPDIESVNFGRGVGYDIIEHVPPDDIREISATMIREQMKNEGL